ncbi:uncharacterized protein LOC111217736 [Seriola dumerili]|uniref:uncharacterized protein LOC111217736 n=1 Tax=Seriola dumerili TaxID=41447 RepID=UPI000BBE283C|nr:uncharacterized protein LOC111217736 [Seriola dumerili]
MSGARKELQEALCHYVTDTLVSMASVRGFCETVSKWVLAREEESKMIKDIKDRFDKTDLSLSHVAKSQEKGKAFLEYMDSMVKGKQTCEELEKELAAVLEDTLGGLEKLDCFLDAVEKLAVTSLHVFMENQVLVLPGMITLENIQAVIAAARLICPLLLEFKRDARVFFTPRLQNAEVLSYQLDRYIQTIQIICEQFEKSSLWDFCLKKTKIRSIVVQMMWLREWQGSSEWVSSYPGQAHILNPVTSGSTSQMTQIDMIPYSQSQGMMRGDGEDRVAEQMMGLPYLIEEIAVWGNLWSQDCNISTE